MKIYELQEKPGERMGIFTQGDDSLGVLVLLDRQEQKGPHLIVKKKYPIVSFEMPLETCGINEPDNYEMHG